MELGELKAKTSLKNPVQTASSEGTKIEQARAFAEVAMQVDLAKKYPRNMIDVFTRIEETFERSPGLLLKAKWKPFKRGGQEITGFTIQFARAIAECVGNIKYSFRELSRMKGQSEMMIYAWDMETNTIQDRTIIVPHTRDKTDYKTGRRYTEKLTHERDIYENNSNASNRRLRDCILGVLPAAARRKGEEVVEELLRRAYPEEKMQEYIEKAIATFEEMGVTRQDLIKERGDRPPELWTRSDLVTLKGYAEDIVNGDILAQEIFFKKTSAVRFEKFDEDKPEPKKPKVKSGKKMKKENVTVSGVTGDGAQYNGDAEFETNEKAELYTDVARLKELYENPVNAGYFESMDKQEIEYAIRNNLAESADKFLDELKEKTSEELVPALIELQDWMESDEYAKDYSRLAKEGTLTAALIKEAQTDPSGRKAADIMNLVRNSK